MFDVFVFTLTFVDIVGGLHVTISRHLCVLVYLCNKLVIVAAVFIYLLFLMLTNIRLFRNNFLQAF